MINPHRLSIERMATVFELRQRRFTWPQIEEKLDVPAHMLQRYFKEATDKGFQAWKGYIV
jgi:hypothetical protein